MASIDKCRSCGAAIRWARTEAGKSIPLDVEPERRFVFVDEDASDEVVMQNTYQAHFSTCPHADQHRRSR